MDIDKLFDPDLARKLPPFQRVMMLLGTAIVFCQGFEKLFIVVARTAFKNPTALSFEEVSSLTGATFKQPLRALLNELSKADQIDQTLATRIGALIDDRNLLVHNIILAEQLVNQEAKPDDVEAQIAATDSDWPVEDRKVAVDNAALIHLCKKVIRESALLGAELLSLFVNYLDQFPEASDFAKRNNLDLETVKRAISDMVAQISSMPAPT